MNSEEMDMTTEINLVRNNPVAYIPYIEDYIKDLQRNAMNTCKISDIDDIMFNFIIGGNGDVFEGRGWNIIGEHSPGKL